MKKNVSFVSLFLVLILFIRCEDSGNDISKDITHLDLKESVTFASDYLDEAIVSIEGSLAYQMLVNKPQLKSISDPKIPNGTITLDDIKGVYDYAPELMDETNSCYKYFERTGNSDWFIVQLPFNKVLIPSQFFDLDSGEGTINNYKMTTTDFMYQAADYKHHSYHLDTQFDLDDEFFGSLTVTEERTGIFDVKYSSRFGFENDFFLNINVEYGNRLLLNYRFEDYQENILFAERVSFDLDESIEDVEQRFNYELIIGDVRIVKTINDEGDIVYLIYKGDELQEDAVVEIVVNEDESETSISCMFANKNKDIKITFDDETSVLLSDLLGESSTNLAELFESMSELYFAKMIVNKLAWQIYNEINCQSVNK